MKLRIGFLSTFYHTSFVLKGGDWIKQELGADSEWRQFGGGPAIVDAFERGELDFGYIGLPPMMIGVDRGVQIKCVAGGHVEGTILAGPEKYKSLDELGRDMKATLQQFAGSTLGSPPHGSIHDVIIRHYINDAGLEKEIEVRNFAWADFIPEAILAGEVVATVGTPPLAVLCARSFNSKLIIPPDKLWPFNPSYGIHVSASLSADNPDLVERFVAMHEKAAHFMRTRPSEAADVVIQEMGGMVEKDFVLDSYRISPRYCAALPDEYIRSTLAFVPVLRAHGYIKKALSTEDIFDLSVLEKVHPEPPHYLDGLKD